MRGLVIKIKEIYVPFVILGLLSIIGYSILRWLLIVKYELFPITTETLDIWFPSVLSMLFVFKFLGKRFKILNISGLHDQNFAFITKMVMVVTIVVPFVIIQDYFKDNIYQTKFLETIFKFVKAENALLLFHRLIKYSLYGFFISLFLISIIPVNKRKYVSYKNKWSLPPDDFDLYINYFSLKKENNKATAILLNINVIWFFVTVLAGLDFMSNKTSDIIFMGGLRKRELFDGEVWRILSSFFMHSNAVHLIANMYGLCFVNMLLEKKLKSNVLLLFFLSLGIIINVTCILWIDNSVIIGISGALFSLYGIAIAFILYDFEKNDKKEFSDNYLIMLLFCLVVLFVSLSKIPSIVLANIFGFIIGFLIGIFITKNKNKSFIKTIIKN